VINAAIAAAAAARDGGAAALVNAFAAIGGHRSRIAGRAV
jgi:hypothetical protein